MPSSNIFIRLPNKSRTILTFPHDKELTIIDLLCRESIDTDNVYVTVDGLVINPQEKLQNERIYTLHIRARGGKGGFGSMLRAIGAQIEKTTNREACRDLSGRRMRDVNNEKKMVEYIEKKSKMEEDKAKKKQEKLEKLTRKPQHMFNDPDYERSLHDSLENVDDAVQAGVAKLNTKLSEKRKLTAKEDDDVKPNKSMKLWLGNEFDDLSESDSDSEEENSRILTSQVNYQKEESEVPSTSGTTEIYEECTKIETNKDFDLAASNELPASNNKENRDMTEVCEKQPKENVESSCNSEESDKQLDTNVATVTKTADNSQQPSVTSDKNEKDNSKAIENETPTKADMLAKNVLDSESIEDLLIRFKACKELNEVMSLGIGSLKRILMHRGVKCGGTLEQRAHRAFKIKNLKDSEIESGLLAKKTKR